MLEYINEVTSGVGYTHSAALASMTYRKGRVGNFSIPTLSPSKIVVMKQLRIEVHFVFWAL